MFTSHYYYVYDQAELHCTMGLYIDLSIWPGLSWAYCIRPNLLTWLISFCSFGLSRQRFAMTKHRTVYKNRDLETLAVDWFLSFGFYHCQRSTDFVNYALMHSQPLADTLPSQLIRVYFFECLQRVYFRAWKMAWQAVPRPLARYEAHLGMAWWHAGLFMAWPGPLPIYNSYRDPWAIIRKSWLSLVHFFAYGSAKFLCGWLLMISATSRSGFDYIRASPRVP
jgi:hypothetical protein